MTTSQEVDAAQKVYEELLNNYLIEKGWVEFDTDYHLWSKGGRGVYTNEEAYWREVGNDPSLY